MDQKRPRMMAPDVARGLALLGIAMANIPSAWMGVGIFGQVNSTLDKIAVLFSAMFVHNRGLPMFSTLLGFGVGLITISMIRKHFSLSQARGALIKRYLFLTMFGVIHCLLLFFGDIMTFYGLAAVIIATMLPLKDATIRLIAYILFGLTGIFAALLMAFPTAAHILTSDAGMASDTALEYYGTSIAVLISSLVMFPLQAMLYLPIMLIGYSWARRGVLADVHQHRTELYIWSGIAIAIIIGIGIPWGLTQADTFTILNFSIGQLSGPGILAICALSVDKIKPSWLTPFAALGKRSMSGYLMQSILCYPLFLGFTLGIKASAAGILVYAFGIWLITLLLACLLEKKNLRGPFEWLHRRLSYGPTLQLTNSSST
ncbi:DUF418 domain-containing protein [Corynebacterium diphtheriae]|uniref:DUF418 domain-containing protein n=1 Tax=Corynebacterium diphtheriae TaxID=1717 RepID=UPI0018C9BC72|nr:DUF418 domain-containing protein [Corynebacterium diphtheriae]MBG9356444.1 DUF418 domain-containing protein [Corynebacterium diphtheriae bv. mitis]